MGLDPDSGASFRRALSPGTDFCLFARIAEPEDRPKPLRIEALRLAHSEGSRFGGLRQGASFRSALPPGSDFRAFCPDRGARRSAETFAHRGLALGARAGGLVLGLSPSYPAFSCPWLQGCRMTCHMQRRASLGMITPLYEHRNPDGVADSIHTYDRRVQELQIHY